MSRSGKVIWRNELAAHANLASDDRRELETHLRDSIAEFQQRGLNDEESFWLARWRIGQPKILGEEFEKADPAKVWRERIFWMVLAYLVISLWGMTVNGIFPNLFRFVGPDPRRMLIANAFDYLFHLAPLIVFAVLLAKGKCLSYFQKRFAYFSTRRRLAVAAMSWILINATLLIFPRFGTLTPEIHQMMLWSLLSSVLFIMIFPLVLVVLLLWLMPTQNRKTPETRLTSFPLKLR